jgi:hypothetical protein
LEHDIKPINVREEYSIKKCAYGVHKLEPVIVLEQGVDTSVAHFLFM